MGIRYDIQEKKEKELIQIIETVTNESSLDSCSLFEEFKNSCIHISPPEESFPIMSFVTFDSLKNYKNGHSIKAGNITLNIKKLIDSIPAIVETSIGFIYDIPILKICAALTLCKTFRDIFTVEITREQAIVLFALWKNCDGLYKISISEGFTAVNTLYKNLDDCIINQTIYNQIIDQLVTLQCISIADGEIHLRESINKEYN